jgi:hypothetical protein
MERVAIIREADTKKVFAMVSQTGRSLSFVGSPGPGQQWATMQVAFTGGEGKLESVIEGLDLTLSVEGPKKMTRQLRIEFLKMAGDIAKNVEEDLPDESKSHFGTDALINNSDSLFWRAQINYKALASRDDTYLFTLGYEFKVRKPIPFDLPNGGRGFRCPPGLGNGGAFTDRYGRNCGPSTSRRLLNAVGNIGGDKPKPPSERGSSARRPTSSVSGGGRTSRRTASSQFASRRGASRSPRSEGD